MAEKYGGYDFEVVRKDNESDFQCTICTFLLKEASETPCHHAFCRVCLSSWEDEKRDRDQTITCPLCATVYDPIEVHFSGIVDRMIRSSINVKCQKHKQGCQWTGKISDFETHQTICLYTAVTCMNNGCKNEFLRKDINSHEEQCPFRLIKCEYCHIDIPFINLENHVNDCPMTPILCSNQECEIQIPRQNMEEHRLNDCLYQLIDCDYKQVGCDEKVQRYGMANHHKEFDEKHKLIMLNSFIEMKNQLADKDQQLHTIEKQLEESKLSQQQTQHSLIETTTRLYRTEAKLHETIVRLNETTTCLNETKAKLNEIEMRLKFSKQVQDEMKEQIKWTSKNVVSAIEVLSTAFIEEEHHKNQQHQSFKTNLLILKDTDIERDLQCTMNEEKVEILGEKLSFYKLMCVREIFLKKLCYKSRYKRFCNLMKFGRFYSADDGTRYIKIEMKKDCIRPKLSIRDGSRYNFIASSFSSNEHFKIEFTEEATTIHMSGRNIYLIDSVTDTELSCDAIRDFPFPKNDGYLLLCSKKQRYVIKKLQTRREYSVKPNW